MSRGNPPFGVTPVLWAVFVADSAGVASGAAAAALDVIKTDAVTAAAAARLVRPSFYDFSDCVGAGERAGT